MAELTTTPDDVRSALAESTPSSSPPQVAAEEAGGAAGLAEH